MKDINRVELKGRICQEPKVFDGKYGQTIYLTVVTNFNYLKPKVSPNDPPEYGQISDFHSIQISNDKIIDRLHQQLDGNLESIKGKQVHLVGSLKHTKKDDVESGTSRVFTSIKISNREHSFDLLQPMQKKDNVIQNHNTKVDSKYNDVEEILDDKIPF